MFSSDLTNVRFHVFCAGCRIGSSDIVSLIRNRAWGGLSVIDCANIQTTSVSYTLSNARNLIPFQLGFCTICPTSLFFTDFIEVVRTDSTNDTDHPLQTFKLTFFLSSNHHCDHLLSSVTCVVVCCCSWFMCLSLECENLTGFIAHFKLSERKQLYNLKPEHKHVFHTAQCYCLEVVSNFFFFFHFPSKATPCNSRREVLRWFRRSPCTQRVHKVAHQFNGFGTILLCFFWIKPASEEPWFAYIPQRINSLFIIRAGWAEGL